MERQDLNPDDLQPEENERLRRMQALESDDVGSYLREWEQRRKGHLRHFTARLNDEDRDFVEETLQPFQEATDGDRPNRRGRALVRLCQAYRKLRGQA